MDKRTRWIYKDCLLVGKNGPFEALISRSDRTRYSRGVLETRSEACTVSSGEGNPRDSCTTNVNLSRPGFSFFFLRSPVWGIIPCTREKTATLLNTVVPPLHTPALSLSPEKKRDPSNRDHRRCGSKLDDPVKSKTPDASELFEKNQSVREGILISTDSRIKDFSSTPIWKTGYRGGKEKHSHSAEAFCSYIGHYRMLAVVEETRCNTELLSRGNDT